MNYDEFIAGKSQLGGSYGFEPLWMPDFLFDFQKHLVSWMLRKGRSACFADCGLGKSAMELVFAENVVHKTNGRVLIMMPLVVCEQMESESEKFNVEAEVCRDGKFSPTSKIILTNYERLHYFNPNDFVGAVGDESSVLKNFDGAIKEQVTEFMRRLQYRSLWTATPSPNDYIELGTSSECLGELGYMDMLGRFFKAADGGATAHGGHGGRFDRSNNLKRHGDMFGGKFRFRGHAERDFWRWVCSWARACRKPSDLGFDDGKFVLPKLTVRQHIVKARASNLDALFDLPAITLEEQRRERRRTVNERCEIASEFINNHDGQSVAWCSLNDEGDLLEHLIKDCVQVAGKDSDESKLEKLKAFRTGQVKRMVTKGEVAGWGVNWQFSDYMTYFADHSFEKWYQCVRRLWRFGQSKPVGVDVIASEGESRVLENQHRKSVAAEAMFAQLVDLMNNELQIEKSNNGDTKAITPSWLKA